MPFFRRWAARRPLPLAGLQGARLYVTATHLRTGRLHVFGDDPNDRVLDALMASTALIPLHPPWEIDGEKYVDGGTVTPLPLRVALERGATEIFALHIYDPDAPPVEEGVHGVPAHISKAVDTMLRLQAEYDLHLAGDLRRVRLHYLALHAPFAVDPTDFGHSEALMAAGHTQARAFLEQELKPTLPAPGGATRAPVVAGVPGAQCVGNQERESARSHAPAASRRHVTGCSTRIRSAHTAVVGTSPMHHVRSPSIRTKCLNVAFNRVPLSRCAGAGAEFVPFGVISAPAFQDGQTKSPR